MDAKIVVIPVNELRNLLIDVQTELENRKQTQKRDKEERETLYTVNEVAKRLRRAHSTIKRLVAQGVLRSTPDGLISEKAINDYLKNA